ncbi:hypothetical protein ACFYW6_37905 [Streptomyces sp. NPDC002659]|uniref:hypothetical protein n=1 Tax=Streptomyces sp. NPDC002659 TaxID=3364656 RepID=UPI0036D0BB7F
MSRTVRPIKPSRSAGPAGEVMLLAVVTVSAAVWSRTVKLMRSMSRPGRVLTASTEARMSAW